MKMLDRPVNRSSASETSCFDGVLRVIYESISDLNIQLPEHQKVEKSPTAALLGTGGTLDSLALANFIVIAEQKLRESLGFAVDLTRGDAFSATGHFRTVQSLATYISEMAETKSIKTSL